MRRQSWLYRGLTVAGLVLGLALPAQAALLEDKGSFAYTDGVGNTGFVNLIYDDDRNITWLADANLAQTSGFDGDGLMTWSVADAWAGGLTVGFGTDWRLPTTTQPDASCALQDTFGGSVLQGFGTGCTGSEMGHLFYDELGGNANESVLTQTSDTAEEIANLALFSNVQANFYWSGTVAPGVFRVPWLFNFNNGVQNANITVDNGFAWAVHAGDVAAVPAPSAMLLMGSGLIGLLAWRRLRRG